MGAKPNYLPKPQNYDELFPGRFLKAGMLKGKDVTLTIKDVNLEKMEAEGGGEEVKATISIKERDLDLALNVTNATCLKGMFGKSIADWKGKRITIYPTTCQSFGETVECIRVRGSPDIGAPVRVKIKLRKKSETTVTMQKTGADKAPPKSGAASSTSTAPPVADGSESYAPPDDAPGFEPGSDG